MSRSSKDTNPRLYWQRKAARADQRDGRLQREKAHALYLEGLKRPALGSAGPGFPWLALVAAWLGLSVLAGLVQLAQR